MTAKLQVRGGADLTFMDIKTDFCFRVVQIKLTWIHTAVDSAGN